MAGTGWATLTQACTDHPTPMPAHTCAHGHKDAHTPHSPRSAPACAHLCAWPHKERTCPTHRAVPLPACICARGHQRQLRQRLPKHTHHGCAHWLAPERQNGEHRMSKGMTHSLCQLDSPFFATQIRVLVSSGKRPAPHPDPNVTSLPPPPLPNPCPPCPAPFTWTSEQRPFGPLACVCVGWCWCHWENVSIILYWYSKSGMCNGKFEVRPSAPACLMPLHSLVLEQDGDHALEVPLAVLACHDHARQQVVAVKLRAGGRWGAGMR